MRATVWFFVILILALAQFAAAEDKPQFIVAPGSPMTLGGSPGSSDAGDLNGDGALDLAVVNRDSNDLSVLLSAP